MKKATILQQLTTPDGCVQALVERDGQFMIWVNGRELMSTRHAFSEEQLGAVGCAPLRSRKGARVLIGGLGLGFTLRAALSALPQDAHVIVAELIGDVVEWNRNPAYPLARDALADHRTEIVVGDVAHAIKQSENRFDAILLDADNQTTAMNTAGNSSLYQPSGLKAIKRALRGNGSVVFWSAGEDPHLEQRLNAANLDVEVHRVPKYRGARGGGKHVLLIGRCRDS